MVARTKQAQWAPNISGSVVLYGLRGYPDGYWAMFPPQYDDLRALWNANVDKSQQTSIGTVKPVYPEAKRGTWEIVSRDETTGRPVIQLFINGRPWGPQGKLGSNVIESDEPLPEFELELDDA